jgi:predicted phage terminase large subunit-like protein
VIDKYFENELKKSIYRDSYYEFYKDAFRLLHQGESYDDNWHAKYICDQLQAEAERIYKKEAREKDLIINIPFRSSKSMMCTVIFNAWCWTWFPSMKFISVSYSASLALEHSTRTRDLIQMEWYQQLWGDVFQLKSDANSKSDYRTDKGGMRKAVGTGGQITGSGADMLLIDDPINPKQAASDVERKNALDFYNHTLFSRLNQPDIGVRVIVMQRLHEEDLSGHLLKTRPERHRHICIPADLAPQLSPASLKQFYVDGLFWHTRFNRGALSDYKVSLGSKEYAGQLQQLPAPEEGGIIKKEWFGIKKAHEVMRNIQFEPIEFFVDGAYTAKTENDPSALLACFRRGADLFILNVAQVWMEFPDLCKHIVKYAMINGYNHTSRIKIEPKASGISLVQSIRSSTGLNVMEAQNPDNDKVTRLNSVAPIIEARRIWLIEGDWNDDFISEVTTFPNAKHDDRVDVLVMSINELLVTTEFSWNFI